MPACVLVPWGGTCDSPVASSLATSFIICKKNFETVSLWNLGLELAVVQAGLYSNSSCLSLLSAGIADVRHHVWFGFDELCAGGRVSPPALLFSMRPCRTDAHPFPWVACAPLNPSFCFRLHRVSVGYSSCRLNSPRSLVFFLHASSSVSLTALTLEIQTGFNVYSHYSVYFTSPYCLVCFVLSSTNCLKG